EASTLKQETGVRSLTPGLGNPNAFSIWLLNYFRKRGPSFRFVEPLLESYSGGDSRCPVLAKCHDRQMIGAGFLRGHRSVDRRGPPRSDDRSPIRARRR